MLERIQRSDTHPRIIFQHPQDEVLKLEIVRGAVTGLTQPPTAWTSRVYSEDAV